MPRGGARRPKGSPRTPGSGRKKGQVNHLTASVKAAVEEAFHRVGGAEYLVTVAQNDPKTFCTILGRIIPQQVNAELSGTVGIALAERMAGARSRVSTILTGGAPPAAEPPTTEIP